jgi:hypothetical protein
MTKGRVARSKTLIRAETKRPHQTVTIYNHETERLLDEAARVPYKPSIVYGAGVDSVGQRKARGGLKPDDDRNPNHFVRRQQKLFRRIFPRNSDF